MTGPPMAERTKFILAIGLILSVGLFAFANNSRTRIAKGDIAQLSSACTYISITRDSVDFLPVDGNLYEHLLDGVRELEAFGQSYPQYESLHTSADAVLSAIATHIPDYEPNDPRYAVAMTDLFNSKNRELQNATNECQAVLSKISGTPTTEPYHSTYDPLGNSNG